LNSLGALTWLVVLLLLTVLAACSGSGDDGGNGNGSNGANSNGGSGGNGGGPSGTPYIPPASYAADEAIAKLNAIEALVKEPNRAFVALAQVDDATLQERTGKILFGENETSGLDDVRIALESDDRIGAGEYLFNAVVQYIVPPLSVPDEGEIDEQTLDEVDVNHTFDEDHSDGMPVSAVFKEAILLMIDLWYRI
jgi:hypothetical protein